MTDQQEFIQQFHENVWKMVNDTMLDHIKQWVKDHPEDYDLFFGDD